MDGVEAFGLVSRHMDQLESTDAEAAVENFLNDSACMTCAHRVRLDDSES